MYPIYPYLMCLIHLYLIYLIHTFNRHVYCSVLHNANERNDSDLDLDEADMPC